MLVTQISGNNNSIFLYQSSIKNLIKSGIDFSSLQVNEFKHPVISNNN